MAIDSSKLLPQIKSELRIDTTDDDTRLTSLIDEAIYSLQEFKDKQLCDTVTDPSTETMLTPLDKRFIAIYAAIQYDGDDGLNLALGQVTERVRNK